jgi:hypothetical protein
LLIHLAPVGSVYVPDTDNQGRKCLRATQTITTPKETLCGEPASLGKDTVLPHDHPAACKTCLNALPTNQHERVQPLMFL